MQTLAKLLTSAPGLFGHAARLIDASLPCSDGALSIPAALSLFSTLKCGRVVSKTGIHPNIYTCVIANSGSGKTQAQNIVNKILVDSGLFGLRCGVPTSDSGLCKRLGENNRQLILWDEFGAELESLAMSKTGFERRILKCMMELYSVAGLVYTGKQYATQDRIDVVEPFLNTFAATTGIRFYGSLNDKFLHDGFLSRWILFFPEAQNGRRDALRFSLTPELKEYIGILEKWVPKTIGDIGSILKKEIVELRFASQEAKSLHIETQREFTRRLDKSLDGSMERVFWARALENYVKALIIVTDKEIASYESVLWAGELIESSIKIAIQKCVQFVRPSDKEAIKDRILNLIAPGERISKKDLTLKTYRFNFAGYERSDLIESLIEAELWREDKIQMGDSRKKTTFYLRT